MSSGKKLALLLLLVLFVMSVIRLLVGPPKPRGVIELRVDRYEELSSTGFEIAEATQVAIGAVGSVGAGSEGPDLAVYGWVLSESTRMPVWVMDAGSVSRFEGQLAIVESDTIFLEAGRYSAFLTSYWDGLRNYRRSNAHDRDKWNITLRSADEEVELWTRDASPIQESAETFWAATPLEDDEYHELLFEVHQPAELAIYAIGQANVDDPSPLVDYSWIEDVHTGRPVWHLSLDNTQWAGGARANRMYRGAVVVDPGIYRTVARTNGRHAFDDWEDYPPYDPFGWGITLSTEKNASVTRFDPWMDTDRNPIISIARVGDDELHSRRFTVSEQASVVIWAMGEMTSEDGRWDTARLMQTTGGQDTELWNMTYQSSLHGGGSYKNRIAVQFLQLEPGEYQLIYESDGSHSYEDWNDDPPHHPERWGATLFPVSENAVHAVTELP